MVRRQKCLQCPPDCLLCSHATAFRVAQVRLVFSISKVSRQLLFRDHPSPPEHLAYVEWFTPFRARPETNSKLYKVSRSFYSGSRVASIVPVIAIEQSIHLIPLAGCAIPREWNSHSVIEHCAHFLVNSFTDR